MRILVRSRAFTLIELLVVIVILGILMAVAVPTFLAQQNKAQDSKTQQQLATAYKAIRSDLPSFNNAYPSTASVVSAIAASEPELTVSSGSCNASTSDKHVVVDNVLTGPTKLSLYAKSGNGYWWNLTASASGAPVFTRLGTCQGPLATGTLTASGNEITDATRAQNVQGDGLSGDSSYGLWEPTINLVTNGGFESNTTGWQATTVGGGTPAISTTSADHVFGHSALQFTSGTVGTLNAARYNITLAASTTYTASAWIKVIGGSGAASLSFLGVVNSPQATTQSSLVSNNGTWQRYTITFTTDSSAQTSDYIDVRVSGTPTSSYTILLDGVQIEAQPTPTPYVETNGATAARGSSELQMPGSLVTETQGWFAVRFRAGFSHTDQPYGATPGFGPQVAFFGSTSPTVEGLELFYRDASNDWRMRVSDGANDASTDAPIAATQNAGDTLTLIGTWQNIGTANGLIALSVNGSPFLVSNPTSVDPAISSPWVQPGGLGPGSAADGSILWFACGTGKLSNSDASTINSWGNNDPTTQDFPAAAQATAAWSADNATYVTGN